MDIINFPNFKVFITYIMHFISMQMLKRLTVFVHLSHCFQGFFGQQVLPPLYTSARSSRPVNHRRYIEFSHELRSPFEKVKQFYHPIKNRPVCFYKHDVVLTDHQEKLGSEYPILGFS